MRPEVGKPRRRFPWPATLIVGSLYALVLAATLLLAGSTDAMVSLVSVLLALALGLVLPLFAGLARESLETWVGEHPLPSVSFRYRAVVLAGGVLLAGGLGSAAVGGILLVRGAGVSPYLWAGVAGVVAGGVLLLTAGALGGRRLLLAEAIRRPPEPGPAPPLGGEPLHVKWLAIAIGLAACGAGVLAIRRLGALTLEAGHLLAFGFLLLVLGGVALWKGRGRGGDGDGRPGA